MSIRIRGIYLSVVVFSFFFLLIPGSDAVTYKNSSSVNVESKIKSVNGNADVYKKIEIESDGKKETVESSDPGETSLMLENENTKAEIYQNIQNDLPKPSVTIINNTDEDLKDFMKDEPPDFSYKTISLRDYIIRKIRSFIQSLFR